MSDECPWCGSSGEHDDLCAGDPLETLTQERDEARAEVERLCADLHQACCDAEQAERRADALEGACKKALQSLDHALDRIDSIVPCQEDDGSWGVTADRTLARLHIERARDALAKHGRGKP